MDVDNPVFLHPFFVAGYGSLLWFLLVFTITKSKNEKTFKTGLWLKENWDDFLLTICVGFGLVILDDEILKEYNQWKEIVPPLTMKTWYYLLPGPSTDFLIRLVKKLRNGTH